jgi:hypothetical protein
MDYVFSDGDNPQSVGYWIDKAAELGIILTAGDFVMIDGELTVDSMPPDEWLEAVAGEED